MRIGDITKQSFKDLWFGKKRQEVRDRVNPKIHCGFHCIRDDSNKHIESVLNGEKSILKNGNPSNDGKICLTGVTIND